MAHWHLTRSFDWKDGRIAWDVLGHGRPVVLVHGFPGNSYSWRNIAPRFAASHQVYILDLAGFGASQKHKDQEVGHRVQARLLGALLDLWGLEEPDVVAHDFGASVVLGSALFDGRRLGRTVLIDAAKSQTAPGREIHARSAIPRSLRDHALGVARRDHAAAHLDAMHTPMDEQTFDGYFQPWRDRKGQAGYYRFLSQFDDVYLDDMEGRLGDFDSPTRILWGEKDTWIPLEQGERLHGLLSRSELVTVPRAAHFVMDDAPDAVFENVEQFLGTTAW